MDKRRVTYHVLESNVLFDSVFRLPWRSSRGGREHRCSISVLVSHRFCCLDIASCIDASSVKDRAVHLRRWGFGLKNSVKERACPAKGPSASSVGPDSLWIISGHLLESSETGDFSRKRQRLAQVNDSQTPQLPWFTALGHGVGQL